MGIQTHEITINDNTYVFNSFSASKGIALFQKIMKVIGPSFGTLFEGKAEDEEQSDKALSKAISLLCENLDKEDVVQLIKDLTKTSSRELKCNNSVVDFDTHFAGKYGELMQLLVFIFKVNYSDFLSQSGLVNL